MSGRARDVFGAGVLILSATIAPATAALAQQRVLRVLGDDSVPVAYANVTVEGERPKITNEKGEVELGAAPRAAFIADVRRLGYEPWYGKLAMTDSVFVVNVELHRLARRMFTVRVTDSSALVPRYLRGFYERMLQRQRGVGTGLYITPEEVEKRNAGVSSSLVQGLNGVSVGRTTAGKSILLSANGQCMMSVLVDGQRVCPARGCNGTALPGATAAPEQSTGAAGGRRQSSRSPARPVPPGDDQYVIIDNVLTPNEVAAVEVYPRGASVPQSLPSADGTCGIVAFWTGGRRAP